MNKKPPKKLKHFVATHKKTGAKCDFYFYSLKQAYKFNPSFIDWVEIVPFKGEK